MSEIVRGSKYAEETDHRRGGRRVRRAPLPSLAQGKKDSVVLGMALEPPGLDPTNAAAAAIAEVTLYNIYETLTKINADGTVSPLLAESWEVSTDLKTYTFKLRKGVKFQNGEPFNSAAVKFSFDRNAAPTSTNKDKRLYQAFESGHRARCGHDRGRAEISNRTCRSCWARRAARSSSRRARDQRHQAGRHRTL